VFTILGTRERRKNAGDQEVVPLPFVYALLSSKQTEQYTTVLQAVQAAAEENAIQNFGPHKIMSDFEKGILNACNAVFPDAATTSCFFHLKQSLYRKIQEEGLQTLYNNPDDETIRLQSHMISALAFVPTDHVSRVFRMLQDEVEEKLDSILFILVRLMLSVDLPEVEEERFHLVIRRSRGTSSMLHWMGNTKLITLAKVGPTDSISWLEKPTLIYILC